MAKPPKLARLLRELADDDVARDHFLPAEFFNAEALAAGVATVLDRTLTFLVSHKIIKIKG